MSPGANKLLPTCDHEVLRRLPGQCTCADEAGRQSGSRRGETIIRPCCRGCTRRKSALHVLAFILGNLRIVCLWPREWFRVF
mmetsp:Transcript_79841/g.165970  ORF Transcript_79841/g.165970 Transcript_79841/m.165970 type:complete len:82 (+) Transcript_79841:1221-1466(+)